MTWNNRGRSRGTKHNKRVRGGGTWGEQSGRLTRHQQERYRRKMGRGTWSERGRRLGRAERRRERDQRNLRRRRTTLRAYSTAAAAGALIFGTVLLTSRVTRGTGLMMLVLAGLVLYLALGRKRA